jgi:Mycotoxin biosynthesis protein UstYa
MYIDDKFHASLSVIHGLHCLNAVRVHLDSEYYSKHGGLHQDGRGYPTNFTRTHMCKFFVYCEQLD